MKFNEFEMPCLKDINSQTRPIEEGKSSNGKKIMFKVKSLDDNLENSEIQPQVVSDQEVEIK